MIPSSDSRVHIADTNSAYQLPQHSVTRYGRKFRANAAPFISSVTLPSIPEDNDSSSYDDELSNTGDMTHAAPRKGPAPIQRYQTPIYDNTINGLF